MDFQDKTIMCKDCGKEFLDSAKQQQFREEKGWGDTPPKRCANCRIVYRNKLDQQR
jgi:Probable zinc-ribbon domain